MRDFFELPYYYFKSKWFNWREEKKVRTLFYPDARFKALDQAVLKSANPYKIPQAFPYGETPLTGFKTIAEKLKLGKNDHFYELGCGRGRGALFLAHFYGCKVTAVDWEPSFIDHAQKVADAFGLANVQFQCADFRKMDFSSATAVYLYGTCLGEESEALVHQSLKTLKTGAMLTTVSQPLLQNLSSVEEVEFPWGQGHFFFQEASHS